MSFEQVIDKFVVLEGKGSEQKLTIRPTSAGVQVCQGTTQVGVYDPDALTGAFDAVMALMAELNTPDPAPPQPQRFQR